MALERLAALVVVVVRQVEAVQLARVEAPQAEQVVREPLARGWAGRLVSRAPQLVRHLWPEVSAPASMPA